MLINAHYLNDTTLTNYIAALEGGLRESTSSRSKAGHSLGASLGSSFAKVEGEKGSESEDTLELKDHQASRLQRLIAAGRSAPDEVGWIEVVQPDLDFPSAGTGAFIDWECDVYVPELIASMETSQGLGNAIKAMTAMTPAAKVLGANMDDMPDMDSMNAMVDMLDQLDVALVVVGEDSETDWKIVGSLTKDWISATATFDDRARVVGKVKKRVPAGKWYPMMSLPGMNLRSREDRRRMEREGPQNLEDEKQFIEGPLLVVDFLAIYI